MSGLFIGDCMDFLSSLSDGVAQSCITSPPYNIGKAYEKSSPINDYLDWIDNISTELFRVTHAGGSVFWQVGNHVQKGEVFPLDILTYPAFKRAGFILRNRIVWTFGHGLHCKKRLSGRHETVLWFTKSDDYKFNLDDIRVPSKYPNKRHFKGPRKGELSGNPLGKNPGDVWDIPNVKHNHPEKTDHPCQFPEAIVERAILATTDIGDLVIDPFLGSGTTAKVAKKLCRRWAGSEQMIEYVKIIKERIAA